ncbi:MAG: PD40 domain-containing protein [Acidobacteria bacterium]|nr:PD40 domain-containing protein [Acidobacteriota bacterium]
MKKVLGSRFWVLGAVLGSGFLGSWFLGSGFLSAQAPPATEIFLAPLTTSGGKVTVGRPVNITNNPGYDNQPQFLADSSCVLFSSMRDGVQTDIYRYEIASKRVVQVTNTTENEYSPTLTPDGQTFSTVRGAQQKLWRFTMDGTDAGLAVAHMGLIGYHVWVSPTQVATFVLGANREPNTMQLLDLRTGSGEVLEKSIGRSLLIRPGHGTVSFVHKPQGSPWVIRELNPKTKQMTTLTTTVEGSEDLAWTPDGKIVMGQKGKLMMWSSGQKDWTDMADLTKQGVENITRLTVSPDGRWIALVSQAAVSR